MRARTRWLAAIGVAATIVAACAGASGPATSSDPGAKAGGKSGPIAITVADSQPSGRPSNLPLAEFKRQVEKLSDGTMTVTILAEASHDADPPDSDGPVIDKVRSGVFQMAVVPARAWSAAGVTSLKALQAPFLFESDEHVAAVVNDAAITTTRRQPCQPRPDTDAGRQFKAPIRINGRPKIQPSDVPTLTAVLETAGVPGAGVKVRSPLPATDQVRWSIRCSRPHLQ